MAHELVTAFIDEYVSDATEDTITGDEIEYPIPADVTL